MSVISDDVVHMQKSGDFVTAFYNNCAFTGVHAKEEGLELRSAQYYTHHASGVYQASKPSKLKGLAPEIQSIHRVSHVER